MNRRRFVAAGIAAPFAVPGVGAHLTVAQSTRPAFLDALDVDLARVDELYIRTFQTPTTSTRIDERVSLYWVAALGCVVRSQDDVDGVREAAYPAFPEWYVAGSEAMTLGPPFAAGLGGQSVGDGATAWYWDVDNPDDPDPDWTSFGIACVAIWEDRRLLLLWGCAAVENPVSLLFDLAASTYASWDADAGSLVPSITHLPMGMVILDEGYLHTRPGAPRPRHPGA